MKYDPYEAPNADAWLALSEFDRIDLVRDYHQRQGIDLPNETLHATIHVTVENQIAMGDELPVASKLSQLMEERLDRHDAVHAIGSVLAEHIYDLLSDESQSGDPNAAYFEALETLTAQSWKDSYSE